MHQDELRKVLTEFSAERLAIVQRHEASARVTSHYDFNNTYQYIISREETHLTWLQTALAEFAQALPPPAAAPASGKSAEAPARGLLDEDARYLDDFVERWRPRINTMTHARHRNMLNVVLGESLEHGRLLKQAAAGFEDVLGRRTGGVARVGAVLPTRWME